MYYPRKYVLETKIDFVSEKEKKAAIAARSPHAGLLARFPLLNFLVIFFL